MSDISNSDLYYMLVEKGYRIDIKEENNSKVIRFNGKHATKESNEKYKLGIAQVGRTMK